VTRWARLDAELVRRGLARSRDQAAALVHAGRVRIDGQTATKPATGVEPATALLVAGADTGPAYASRGGYKLAGALDAFAAAGLSVAGRRCLDAGASTGGFTDVLLRRGVQEVVAADVGYGQLSWSLRTDPRVRVLDRTNVRSLTPQILGGPVDLAVADLSFISLRLALGALVGCVRPGGDLVPMVKPQFEVGRDHLGKGGVVRDARLRAQAVLAVAETAASHGLGVAGMARSALPGPAGNLEFFLWLRAGAPPVDPAAVAAATEPDDRAVDTAADREVRP
jgi:23S rRNA (cytidine1920-2'-O)/16S rRNA (cytidine1409-2'-O)-methyltransferase